MKTAAAVQNIAYVILLLHFFPIVIGGVLQQPVGVSFVETESMRPQLEPGDGFFIIPTQMVGSFSVGDVVTFRAENFPYTFVTHRIVGETSQGFITQGDNNTFTDQSGTFNEPYIKREQIVGKVVTSGSGEVIAIPNLGSALHAVGDVFGSLSKSFYDAIGVRPKDQKIAQLLFGLGVFALVAIVGDALSSLRKTKTLRARPERAKRSHGTSPYLYYTVFFLFILFASTVSVLTMEQTNRVDLVATEGNTNMRAVHIGETVERYLEIGNSGLIPVQVYVPETEGIVSLEAMSFSLSGGEKRRITYIITAPTTPGYYQQYVTMDVYLGILPFSTTTTLRESGGRYLPILLLDLVAIAISFPVFVLLQRESSQTQRSRSRSRSRSVNNVL
jgi:signal peptidase